MKEEKSVIAQSHECSTLRITQSSLLGKKEMGNEEKPEAFAPGFSFDLPKRQSLFGRMIHENYLLAIAA